VLPDLKLATPPAHEPFARDTQTWLSESAFFAYGVKSLWRNPARISFFSAAEAIRAWSTEGGGHDTWKRSRATDAGA